MNGKAIKENNNSPTIYGGAIEEKNNSPAIYGGGPRIAVVIGFSQKQPQFKI